MSGSNLAGSRGEENQAWLGALPDDWITVPPRAVLRERKERSRSSDVHLTPSQAYGVLPQSDYMALTGSRVVMNLAGADAMRHVEPGDLISHLRSFQGGLEQSQVRGKVSAAYTVLCPTADLDPGYSKFLFKSRGYVQALQSTTDQLRDGQSIRFGQLALIRLPLPPIRTQRNIARFLERELTEIEDFVDEQQRMVALLSERRVSTIGHAIRRGVEPRVATRATNSEWIGQVPAHWEVTRLSRHFSVVLGKMLDAGEEVAIGAVSMPYVRAANIQESGLDLESVNEMPFTATEARTFDIRGGDLLVVEGGAVGVNAFVSSDMKGWAFQKTVNRVRPRSPRVSAEFLGFVLDAFRWGGVLEMLSNKSTIAHLTAEKLERLVVAFPPIEEQQAIAEYINGVTRRLDESIADARDAIALSRERRAALISAAVTGKIDVEES